MFHLHGEPMMNGGQRNAPLRCAGLDVAAHHSAKTLSRALLTARVVHFGYR